MKLVIINQGGCWNEPISIKNKSRLRKNLLLLMRTQLTPLHLLKQCWTMAHTLLQAMPPCPKTLWIVFKLPPLHHLHYPYPPTRSLWLVNHTDGNPQPSSRMACHLEMGTGNYFSYMFQSILSTFHHSLLLIRITSSCPRGWFGLPTKSSAQHWVL